MVTLLRFFKSGEYKCCEQYRGENLIAPQLNSVVTLECEMDTLYRVDNIIYVYDVNNVMIDVELRPIEDGYFDKHDEYLDNDEFECDGECENCELNDAGTTDKNTNYDHLLQEVADLFRSLGVKVEFTKE